MATYELLLADKYTPDAITYYIIARTALRYELDCVAMETTNQDTANEKKISENDLEAAKDEIGVKLDLTKVMELCDKCRQLEPKLGTKTYRVIVTTLLSEVRHSVCVNVYL